MDQEKIGKFIKKIRQENHLTQKEMADKLGVTFQAVSKWENGKNVPDIAILKQISDEFSVDIEELLEGEKKNSLKRKKLPVGIILFGVLLLGALVFLFIQNQNSDYEFKTISSKCSDFKITGSAAYNKEKATIYISNVEFCGKEDTNIYQNIQCTLYENYKDTKTKISTCKSDTNINLEDYLKKVNINVDHYSKSCKKLTSNSLSLEIIASTKEGKNIQYIIPIKLNDNC